MSNICDYLFLIRGGGCGLIERGDAVYLRLMVRAVSSLRRKLVSSMVSIAAGFILHRFVWTHPYEYPRLTVKDWVESSVLLFFRRSPTLRFPLFVHLCIQELAVAKDICANCDEMLLKWWCIGFVARDLVHINYFGLLFLTISTHEWVSSDKSILVWWTSI